MGYKVESFLTAKSIKEVTNLRGKMVYGIRIATAGSYDERHGLKHNMGFLVAFRENETEIAFLSNSIPTINNIEFPRLDIVRINNCTSDFKHDLEDISTAVGVQWTSQRIDSVSIIRDTVKWVNEGNSWELVIDTGVKLTFENNLELLIIARDSSLGMMDFWIGKSITWIYDPERFSDTYMFDSSELQFIQRVEQVI